RVYPNRLSTLGGIKLQCRLHSVSLIIFYPSLYYLPPVRTYGRTTRILKNLKWCQEMYGYHQSRCLTTQGLCELAEG
ncbi:MAG: hypothetical protein AB8Z05_03520, partial [Coxiella-like endosymbiont]